MTLSNKARRRIVTAVTSEIFGKEIADAIDGGIISSDVTIHVETTGNDATGDSSGAPFATIQAALDYLKPFEIEAVVTIQVGAGTFDGFSVPSELVFSNGGSLQVIGTTTVLATGVTTSQIGRGIFVDSTKDFSTIPVGSLIAYSNATTQPSYVIYQIVGLTRLETAHISPPPLSTPFTIYEIATVVLTNKIAGGDPSAAKGAIVIDSLGASFGESNWIKTGSVAIINLKAVATGEGVKPAIINSKSILLIGCDFTSQGVGTFTSPGSDFGGSISIDGGIFRVGDDYVEAFNAPGYDRLSLTARNIVVLGLAGNTNSTGFFSRSAGSVVTGFIGGIFVDIATPIDAATSSSSSSTLNLTLGILVTGATSIVNISSPTRFIKVVAPLTWTFSSPVANTAWLTLTKGAKVCVSSSVAATGTTEISVDGATSTLANMRAQTPKCFPATPNVYGSYVYE